MGKEEINKLIKTLRSTGFFGASVNERKAAAEALGKIGDSSAVPALMEALRYSEYDVRTNAAKALVKIGKSAVPYLIKALGDSNQNARVYAAEALGNINDKSALKALEYIMKNDPEKVVRKAAFNASAKIRSSRGILEEEPTQKVSVEGDLKYIHVGDKIGTQVKDSFVWKSNISSVKKCPNCGREVGDIEKFCLECGAKL